MSGTPQLLIHVNDPKLGFLGYLAVDSFLRNKASGGIRVKIGKNDPNEEYALEAAWLAREMTLKYGFHRIPQGGAKAIVLLPHGLDRPGRDAWFQTLGWQLGPLLQKNFIQVGQDMGMNERDLYFVGVGAGLVRSPDIPSEHKKSDSGRFTALGLMETFRTACRFYDPDRSTWTCGLEGFGSVGWHLAGYLAEKGTKVVAISTLAGGLYDPAGLDVQRLMALQKEHGDSCINHYNNIQRIEPARLFEKKVDALFPCGGFFSINQSNVHNLQCRMIISGANGTMDEECAEIVERRGIHYLPGFVANAGSVLKNYMAKQEKITRAEVLERRTREFFGQHVEQLLEESKKKNLSVCEQAVNIAKNNIQKMSRKDDISESSLRRRIVSLWKKQI